MPGVRVIAWQCPASGAFDTKAEHVCVGAGGEPVERTLGWDDALVRFKDVVEFLRDRADKQNWQEHRLALHEAADALEGNE